jgi:hypothetical protein
MYQTNIHLGSLTAANIAELSDSERWGLFIRRAAAEIAYSAWIFTPPAKRGALWPGTTADIDSLTVALMAASVVANGHPHHHATFETIEGLAARNVRVGLAHGWRLAAANLTGLDLTPRWT